MALPKQIRPEYSTTIPSNGKKIKFQPFTVKEEKILVLAAESQDADEISNAISNVLGNCITSPADLNVEELALFDIEYLFLKARAKSAGETVKVRVKDPDDETYEVEHEINIDSIKVKKNAKHTETVELGDGTIIKLKYPGIQFFNEGIGMSNIEESTAVVPRCISQICIGEEVYNEADMTRDEVTEWLDGLTTESFAKVMEFFETMPKLSHTLKLKNKKTGDDFSVTLEGLADFF